jgi:hypothetical protein
MIQFSARLGESSLRGNKRIEESEQRASRPWNDHYRWNESVRVLCPPQGRSAS